MKAWRLLMLPWMAWSEGTRRVLAGVATLIVATVILATSMKHQHGVAPSPQTIHVFAVVNFMLWAFALSQTVLFARAAHRLRLPGLGREALAGVMLYVFLTIVLPALLLAWLGANGAVALVELALGAGLGLGYAALPSWLGILALFTPTLVNLLPAHWLPSPALSTQDYLAWATPCAMALWTLIGICWRRTARLDHGLQGINKSILFNQRTLKWYGRNDGGSATELQGLRRGARWWQPTADLRGCGPGHAVTNLRLMLGGWAMPQTRASWMRQCSAWAFAMALGAAFVTITAHDDQGHGDKGILLWVYATMAGPLLAQTNARTLQRRWSRANAELPLTALLPSLGEGRSIKRDLLRACLLPAFAMQCLIAVAAIGAATWLQIPLATWLGLLLAQLTGMGMLAAFVLATLGGKPLASTGQTLILFGYLAVISAGAFTMPTTQLSPAALMSTMLALVILWALLFVPLALIAMRGWRAFQRRPHPFLANQP